jgi:Tfp pilus assembly protein PilO
VDDLERNYNSFSDDQLTRLAKVLPDNVDNVQLIIDINNIAALHGMRIKGIKVKTEEEQNAKNGGDAATRARAIARGNVPQQANVSIAFNVNGSYSEFISFLSDLQKSLRVVDMSGLSFAADDKDFYTYNVELKTYWLK